MASVYRRGRKYYIRYMTGGQEYRESVGPSKRDADRALLKRLTEIAEGRFLDVKKRCKTTFKEFSPRFLAWAKAHKRSHDRDELSVRNLAVHFDSMKLDAIGPGEAEAYVNRRQSGDIIHDKVPQPATINRELRCLSKMLSLATDWGLVVENPIPRGKLRLLREPEGRTRYLNQAEAERLLDACNPRLRPLVELGLLTGMRRGELLGLTWAEVHLERGAIVLPASRTKNSRSRTVPLNGRGRDLLGELQGSRAEGCDLVFHRDGRRLKSPRKAFETACKRAGIANFTFHDLRHSYASALAMAGVPIQTIAELLGHRTLAMARRYSHLSPQTLVAATEQAARYFAPGAPVAPPALALVAPDTNPAEAAPAESTSSAVGT